MNLFKIDAAIAAAIETMFDTVNADGEIDAGTVEAFEELQAERAEKLDALGAYIKNLDAEVAAIDNEIKILKARADVKKSKIERLKEYATASLMKSGDKKFETPRVVFSFRKSVSVDIIDPDMIPENYKSLKIDVVPDKTAIKDALKNGEVITGARLIEKQNIQIK